MIVMDIIAERVGFSSKYSGLSLATARARLLIPPFIETIACHKGKLFFQRCAFEKIRTDFAQNL